MGLDIETVSWRGCAWGGEQRVREARSSRRGEGLGLPGCGFPGLPNSRLGPRCLDSLAPDSSPSHPLAHKDFSRWRFPARRSPTGNGSERPQWLKLRGPPRAVSRRGRAAAPARGEARPRGPRAARQAARAAPLPPRLPPGAHPSTGRGVLGAGTQRAFRVRPRPGSVPLGLHGSESGTLLRAPAESPHAEGPSTRAPQTPGTRPGVLGPAAQVRPRVRKPDPQASGLLRCAPRR